MGALDPPDIGTFRLNTQIHESTGNRDYAWGKLSSEPSTGRGKSLSRQCSARYGRPDLVLGGDLDPTPYRRDRERIPPPASQALRQGHA